MKTEQDRAKSMLRIRAEKLARSNHAETAEIAFAIVEFRIGQEKFGIDSKYVEEISKNRVCHVPMVPAHIAGIANIRGRTVDVVNPEILLGVKSTGENAGLLMTISSDQLEFAFPVDEVFGIRQVMTAEIQDKPNAASVLDRRKWLQAVTIDGVQIMDGGKVLSDVSLVVNED